MPAASPQTQLERLRPRRARRPTVGGRAGRDPGRSASPWAEGLLRLSRARRSLAPRAGSSTRPGRRKDEGSGSAAPGLGASAGPPEVCSQAVWEKRSAPDFRPKGLVTWDRWGEAREAGTLTAQGQVGVGLLWDPRLVPPQSDQGSGGQGGICPRPRQPRSSRPPTLAERSAHPTWGTGMSPAFAAASPKPIVLGTGRDQAWPGPLLGGRGDSPTARNGAQHPAKPRGYPRSGHMWSPQTRPTKLQLLFTEVVTDSSPGYVGK